MWWGLVVLGGVDDLFMQVLGLGLVEVFADDVLDVSCEGEGWLIIVAH